MLLFLRPFKVGDVIETAGHIGTVVELGLFSTEFKTAQGTCIFVPNASLWGSSIINYSRNDTRRIDIEVGISYDDDIDKARETLLGLMAADDRVLSDPGRRRRWSWRWPTARSISICAAGRREATIGVFFLT